jgi:Mrp family chromosome partitioning ATPase
MENFDRNGLEQFKNMSLEEQQALLERYQAEEEESGGCSGNCSGCTSDCANNENSDLTPRKAKKIYAVFSGKGGAGKSTMTCLLASALAKRGLKVGILDADLTGPSVSHLMGKADLADSDNERVFTVKADNGVEFISMAAVQDGAEKPLLWYGKDLAVGALYFYSEVKWSDDLDVMLVDMPTGIGDVPLQIYTIIPFDGAICVATPSRLCDFVAKKSIALSEMVYIHVLGVIENMASDEEDAKAHAEELGVPMVACVPFDPMLALDGDFGKLPTHERPELDALVETIAKQAAEA